MRISDWTQTRGRRVAGLVLYGIGAKPSVSGLMNGIERGHLHEHVGGGRESAIDKLEIPERSQKRRTAAFFLVPPLAAGKSQRGKEAGQAVIDRGGPGRTKKGNPLDHGLILSRGIGPAFLTRGQAGKAEFDDENAGPSSTLAHNRRSDDRMNGALFWVGGFPRSQNRDLGHSTSEKTTLWSEA